MATGRKGQFFIIGAVLVLLSLMAIGQYLRNASRDSSERPSQEISILSDFNDTIVTLYSRPALFKRNIEAFQFGIQKSSGFASQIYMTCAGLPDCTAVSIGNCTAAPCTTALSVSGTYMKAQSEFSARMTG